jgi:hypothetical protein
VVPPFVDLVGEQTAQGSDEPEDGEPKTSPEDGEPKTSHAARRSTATTDAKGDGAPPTPRPRPPASAPARVRARPRSCVRCHSACPRTRNRCCSPVCKPHEPCITPVWEQPSDAGAWCRNPEPSSTLAAFPRPARSAAMPSAWHGLPSASRTRRCRRTPRTAATTATTTPTGSRTTWMRRYARSWPAERTTPSCAWPSRRRSAAGLKRSRFKGETPPCYRGRHEQ